MMMYVYLVIGFVLLIKGADFFVEASSSVAKMLRVPSIIIGLTIVAFGTSAPELAVSVSASLAGNNEIAVGNVLGSNIFNLLVVLGMCGAIHPFAVRLRWDFGASVVAAAVILAMLLPDQRISRAEGFILLGLFVVFLILMVRDALSNRTMQDDEYKPMNPVKCAVYIVGGLAAIVFGGDLVVDSASNIARSFGLSQTLIGLTIVAFGTSLPELVTSVIASTKGENGLALGNVIGSNIFNIVLVLGLSAGISPIQVTFLSVIDAACLIVFSVIAFFWCKSSGKISRSEGVAMMAMYVLYTLYIIFR